MKVEFEEYMKKNAHLMNVKEEDGEEMAERESVKS